MKSAPMRSALVAVAVLVVLLLGVLAGSYGLTLYAISRSQHRWCATLALLTSKPVPKPADPAAHHSQQDAWLFYVRLKELEHGFRC